MPLIMAAGISMLLSGCIPSYKFNGSAINYDVYKTIDIGEFPIRAALVYPPLQQTFENKLLDAVTRQTRLQEVDGRADLEMTGEITGYSLSPQAVGEDAYATETRLTITVRVKYSDLHPAETGIADETGHGVGGLNTFSGGGHERAFISIPSNS